MPERAGHDKGNRSGMTGEDNAGYDEMRGHAGYDSKKATRIVLMADMVKLIILVTVL